MRLSLSGGKFASIAEIHFDERALKADGQSDEAIQKDLGWSSKEMVERYGHDLPGLGKARANLIQFGSDTILTRDKKQKAKK